MEKLSTNKKLARQVVRYNTFLTVKLPIIVIVVAVVFLLDFKNPWFVIVLIVGSSLVAFFLSNIRINKFKDDSRLLAKWNTKAINKIKDQKNLKNNFIKDTKKSYKIVSIIPHPLSNFFSIQFDSNIIKQATPDVILYDQLMIFKNFKNDTAIYFAKEIPNQEYLLFKVGENFWKFKNPYFVSIEKEMIRWQTKGHLSERNIFIDVRAFKNLNTKIKYEFGIKINRDKFGWFQGIYDKDHKCIKAHIGNFNANCDQNQCLLLTAWNKDTIFEMPKPEILSVNNVFKAKGLFRNQSQC